MEKRKFRLILACIIISSSCGKVYSRGAADDKNLDLHKNPVSKVVSHNTSSDIKEIQNLIRKVLNWADADKTFMMHPCQADNKNRLTGFDTKIISKNIEILQSTGLFANSFIDNYKKLVSTLDKKIRSGEYGECYADELPQYKFASDVDPWTLCQDIPYDNPNPFDYVEAIALKLDDNNGEFFWKWGRLDSNTSTDWKDFTYRFKVKKEDGKWKISYLQGFDYNENI
jgi:hypothetical protein